MSFSHPGAEAPQSSTLIRSDRIIVVGVGRAGCQALAELGEAAATLDLVALSHDREILCASVAPRCLLIGPEWQSELKEMLAGADLCLVATQLDHDADASLATLVAATARAIGIVTVSLVTPANTADGERNQGELGGASDTLLVVQAAALLQGGAERSLAQGLSGIIDPLRRSGLAPLRVADVRPFLQDMGPAVLGVGAARGAFRAISVARDAVSDPLLKRVIQGAGRVLISITGGSDLTLDEVTAAATFITHRLRSDAEILWGSTTDPDKAGHVRICVVASGTAGSSAFAPPPLRSSVRDQAPQPRRLDRAAFVLPTCRRCGQGVARSGHGSPAI